MPPCVSAETPGAIACGASDVRVALNLWADRSRAASAQFKAYVKTSPRPEGPFSSREEPISYRP